MTPSIPSRSGTTGIGRIFMLARAGPGIARLPTIPAAVEANAAAEPPMGVFPDIQAEPLGLDVKHRLDVRRTGGHGDATAIGGEGSR